MMPDEYKLWRPVTGVHGEMYVRRIEEDEGILRIFLVDRLAAPERVLRVTFPFPLIYRTTRELYRLRTLAQLEKAGFPPMPFYIVSNSTWVQWFLEESMSFVDREGKLTDPIEHYAILTENDSVDVIAVAPPEMEWQSTGRSGESAT
jgi:hypothetical protein